MDRLEAMMNMQRELEERLGHTDFDVMRMAAEDVKDVRGTPFCRLHKEYALALMMEANEIMDWMPWKGWSVRLGNKSDVDPMSEAHRNEVRAEVADALHFVLALALLWGISAEELFEAYGKKNAVNHQRQNSGTY